MLSSHGTLRRCVAASAAWLQSRYGGRNMKSFREQMRRHSVALIRLFVAFSSLAYNTWRNEQTEANRNVRAAGMELLLKLGELDQVVFFTGFRGEPDGPGVRRDAQLGWAFALTIRDLGRLTAEPAASSSERLLDTWGRHWEGLEKENFADRKTSIDVIDASIERTRDDVLEVLAALD